jgi:hypothetical protein
MPKDIQPPRESWKITNITDNKKMYISDIPSLPRLVPGVEIEALDYTTVNAIGESGVYRNLLVSNRISTSGYLHTHDDKADKIDVEEINSILAANGITLNSSVGSGGIDTATIIDQEAVDAAIGEALNVDNYVRKDGSINQLSDITSTGDLVENAVTKAHDKDHTLLEHIDVDTITTANLTILMDESNADDLHAHSHNVLEDLQGGTTSQYYHITATDVTNLTILTDGSNADALHVHTGSGIVHNNLTGLQGGVSGEYYHLTEDENNLVSKLGEDSAGLTFDGYLVGADSLWKRSGTTLNQLYANDDIDLGSGDLTTTGNVTISSLSMAGIVINSDSGLLSTEAVGTVEGRVPYTNSGLDGFSYTSDLHFFPATKGVRTGDRLGVGTAPTTSSGAYIQIASSSLTSIYGISGKTYSTRGAGNVSILRGLDFSADWNVSTLTGNRVCSTFDSAYASTAIESPATGGANTMTVTTWSGFKTKLEVAQGAAGLVKVTDAKIFNALSPVLSGGAEITNLYGLYVEDITAGDTLNYAIYTNTGDVYFGDNVETTGNISILSNSNKLYFGTNQDSSIYFDGTDLIISVGENPSVEGVIKLNDDVEILGNLTANKIIGINVTSGVDPGHTHSDSSYSHNSLSGLQGGAAGEYYHLIEEKYNLVSRLDEDSAGLTFDGVSVLDSLWSRTGTTLSPINSGDDISTTGTGAFGGTVTIDYDSGTGDYYLLCNDNGSELFSIKNHSATHTKLYASGNMYFECSQVIFQPSSGIFSIQTGTNGIFESYTRPLVIRTRNGAHDLSFQTNEILAMTIDGTTQDVSISNNLTISSLSEGYVYSSSAGLLSIASNSEILNRIDEDSAGITFDGVSVLDSLWSRTGTTLSPINTGDDLTTTGTGAFVGGLTVGDEDTKGILTLSGLDGAIPPLDRSGELQLAFGGTTPQAFITTNGDGTIYFNDTTGGGGPIYFNTDTGLCSFANGQILYLGAGLIKSNGLRLSVDSTLTFGETTTIMGNMWSDGVTLNLDVVNNFRIGNPDGANYTDIDSSGIIRFYGNAGLDYDDGQVLSFGTNPNDLQISSDGDDGIINTTGNLNINGLTIDASANLTTAGTIISSNFYFEGEDLIVSVGENPSAAGVIKLNDDVEILRTLTVGSSSIVIDGDNSSISSTLGTINLNSNVVATGSGDAIEVLKLQQETNTYGLRIYGDPNTPAAAGDNLRLGVDSNGNSQFVANQSMGFAATSGTAFFYAQLHSFGQYSSTNSPSNRFFGDIAGTKRYFELVVEDSDDYAHFNSQESGGVPYLNGLKINMPLIVNNDLTTTGTISSSNFYFDGTDLIISVGENPSAEGVIKLNDDVNITGTLTVEDLPNSDPGIKGALYNDSGTVKISL